MTFNTNSILVTADVPISDALSVIKKYFNLHPDPKRPNAIILKLLDIILHNNDFLFMNQFYIQTKGVAMGQRFANIYLANWEKELSNHPLFPNQWHRYIDDIFFIRNQSLDELVNLSLIHI